MISDDLKRKVLLKAGLTNITSGDCEQVAIDIHKTLNKEISITTLKRVFGFAKGPRHFSKYTTITLQEYVNTSESKFLSRIANEDSSFSELKGQECLRPNQLVLEALNILLAQGKEFLPIVKQGKYIGCCYAQDLVYFLTCDDKLYGTLFHKFNFDLQSAIFILAGKVA